MIIASILNRTVGAAAAAALLCVAPAALAQDGHGAHAEAGHAHGHSHADFQSDRIHVTQECIALMLGVRRVGVTVAASEFQQGGLIRYHRGELTVLDRVLAAA